MLFYIVVAGLIGGTIPTIWLILYYFHPNGKSFLFELPAWVETVFVALCPGSLLLLSDPLDNSYSTPVIVVLTNVILYGLIGLLLWVGWYRSRTVLFVLLVVSLIYVYKIYTL